MRFDSGLISVDHCRRWCSTFRHIIRGIIVNSGGWQKVRWRFIWGDALSLSREMQLQIGVKGSKEGGVGEGVEGGVVNQRRPKAKCFGFGFGRPISIWKPNYHEYPHPSHRRLSDAFVCNWLWFNYKTPLRRFPVRNGFGIEIRILNTNTNTNTSPKPHPVGKLDTLYNLPAIPYLHVYAICANVQLSGFHLPVCWLLILHSHNVHYQYI